LPGRAAALSSAFLRQVLLQERVRVDVLRVHVDHAVRPRPLGAVAVPVQLDAVALGIGEVERVAHQVVGAAAEGLRELRRDRVQRRGEVGLRVEQDRGVEQAGVVGGRVLHRRRVLEDHDRDRQTTGAGSPQHCDAALVREQRELDAVAVVADHPVEVRDAEGDGTHPGVGGEEVLRVHGTSVRPFG
jgi:hypothetical protein